MFGDEHVDTLTAMYNVGSCLMKQEKFEEAIAQLENVREKRAKHIGMCHLIVQARNLIVDCNSELTYIVIYTFFFIQATSL